MSESPEWKEFEALIERIQRGLHPGASITRNERLLGQDTKIKREIDVCIRYTLGGIDLLLVLDCKKRRRHVSTPEMHSFAGLKTDVRAHAGIMVSENGFSKGARKIAALNKVDLFTLFDTKKANWDCRVRIPICIEDWLILPTMFQLLHPDGKVEDLPARVNLHGKILRGTVLLHHLWNEDADRKAGNFAYEVEFATGTERTLLRIGFTAQVERYVRTAWLSLVGLTKVSDGRTYSDEALVTMSHDSPEFHNYDAMVPPHETSPHAIPARNIAVGGRGEIDLRDPRVTMTLTLKGKERPLVYEIPAKPNIKAEKDFGDYKVLKKEQSS